VASNNGSVLDTATLFKNRTCAVSKSLGDSSVANTTTTGISGPTMVSISGAGKMNGGLVVPLAAVFPAVVLLY